MPFDLLLLADETVEAIEKYLDKCDLYVVQTSAASTAIAVFALLRHTDDEVEIKNMAVAPEFQNSDVGSFILGEIKTIALQQNYKQIILGTTDVDYGQLRFYLKNGFVTYAIKKDFFIDNYPKPIFENGTMLRDMVMLKKELY
ncbi:GNAT family N-acetyltransferase [Flavobacterium sp. UBA7682]|uniref:GNAT family N-acetyltransferase n=1 Tax=Flavobacterium sp. UBA7682 TaxID=1946560 RepID=UPI0025C3B716|nr:GNAT family N-acetyltransferase [Flavobacterium sp. UBA7682]